MICDHEPNPAYGVLDYRKHGVPGVWLVCLKCERVYEEEGYAWETLKKALDADRLGYRKLFTAQKGGR